MRKEQITVTNNSVCNSAENKGLEGKGMKRRLLHFKKRMVPAVSGVLMGVMLMSTTCFAAGTGTSAVTQPLENLKTLIIAVIGAVGVIILAKNVMEFAQAYQQQDSSTMNSALKGIVAGVMMAGTRDEPTATKTGSIPSMTAQGPPPLKLTGDCPSIAKTRDI